MPRSESPRPQTSNQVGWPRSTGRVQSRLSDGFPDDFGRSVGVGLFIPYVLDSSSPPSRIPDLISDR